MKAVLTQPLAQFLGLRESSCQERLLELDFSSKLTNHFDTYHASVLYSLAEYSAGAFLVRYFPDQRYTTQPMVRRAQVKYSHITGHNSLYTTGKLLQTTVDEVIEELETKKRSKLNIQIDVRDSSDQLIFKGLFEWFVIAKP